jgi:hypothetical protein
MDSTKREESMGIFPPIPSPTPNKNKHNDQNDQLRAASNPKRVARINVM